MDFDAATAKFLGMTSGSAPLKGTESAAGAIAKGVHNLDADTLKIALSNAAPNPATAARLANITQIATAGGYVAGGLPVANSSVTIAGGIATLDGDDVEARILEFNPAERRIRLSLRPQSEEPAEEPRRRDDDRKKRRSDGDHGSSSPKNYFPQEEASVTIGDFLKFNQ